MNSVSSVVRRLLSFLNLVDGDRLSLTNLFLFSLMFKSLFTQTSAQDGVLLVTAVASYAHKRHLHAKTKAVADTELQEIHGTFSNNLSAMQAQIAEQQSKLNALSIQSGLRKGSLGGQ